MALFTTAGFTDMLELARLRMPNPYSLFCERPAPLIPRERVFGIAERMSAAGATLAGARRGRRGRARCTPARDAGCDGMVVSFLHAWRKPLHEEQVAAIIARLDPAMVVFRGSEIWPAIREYERTTTAVLNAYVHPRIAGYLDRVAAELERAGDCGAAAADDLGGRDHDGARQGGGTASACCCPAPRPAWSAPAWWRGRRGCARC